MGAAKKSNDVWKLVAGRTFLVIIAHIHLLAELKLSDFASFSYNSSASDLHTPIVPGDTHGS